MSRPSRPSASARPTAGSGFVSPWENGSPLYRRMVLTGSALFLVGIVLSVVGAMTHRLPLSWTALAILGLGMLVHLSAQLVRFRQAAARSAARPATGTGASSSAARPGTGASSSAAGTTRKPRGTGR